MKEISTKFDENQKEIKEISTKFDKSQNKIDAI